MERLITIRTLKELDALTAYLANKNIIAVDTETTGVEKESRIIGFSVAAEIDLAFYVVLSEWNVKEGRLVDLETLKGAKAVLESLAGKSLILHNAIFDCWMTWNNFQVELTPSVHTDTMLLANLLNENRPCGLKELAVILFGEDAREEQRLMKESVHKNGGVLTRVVYELYKADSELMARYGAKDTILTLKLFYHLVPELYEQRLDRFFYDDETMPLMRTTSTDLNRTGLRVDAQKLADLKGSLEAECLESKAFIYAEIKAPTADKYPGTGKTNHFNINATKQLSWLLFVRLGNDFGRLTKEGRELCHALSLKVPYQPKDRREFMRVVTERKGQVWLEAKFNPKTGKLGRPKKVADAWTYIACGKETLTALAAKYKWVDALLRYKKAEKLLGTYAIGIQSRMKYNVIRPSFSAHIVPSGRYSGRNPNFTNLPRDDKRVKACIIGRPGKVFIGADYEQIEARVFASLSQDERLMKCFADGHDFYSVIGMEVFKKYDCTPMKEGSPEAFGVKYKKLRQIAKGIALAVTYGANAPKIAMMLGIDINEAQEVIDNYFEAFPAVRQMMLDSHKEAKTTGQVVSMFGRVRRLPAALKFDKIYGKAKLPYEAATVLNLSVNFRNQSPAASIINRASIAFCNARDYLATEDARWSEVRIVNQVHDQLVIEGPEALQDDMALLLKDSMENTNSLPGVALIARPIIGHSLADL